MLNQPATHSLTHSPRVFVFFCSQFILTTLFHSIHTTFSLLLLALCSLVRRHRKCSPGFESWNRIGSCIAGIGNRGFDFSFCLTWNRIILRLSSSQADEHLDSTKQFQSSALGYPTVSPHPLRPGESVKIGIRSLLFTRASTCSGQVHNDLYKKWISYYQYRLDREWNDGGAEYSREEKKREERGFRRYVSEIIPDSSNQPSHLFDIGDSSFTSLIFCLVA